MKSKYKVEDILDNLITRVGQFKIKTMEGSIRVGPALTELDWMEQQIQRAIDFVETEELDAVESGFGSERNV